MKHTEEYDAFKPIKGPDIVLDFTYVRYLGEVHRELKEKFGFPEYYGENWSALWDCLDGLFEEAGPWRVCVRGYHRMPKELQEGCRKMLEIFDRVQEKTPNVKFSFEEEQR